MTDHPKIIALDKLIMERRMVQAKVLMRDIDVDLMRLKELDQNKTEEGGDKK